ncbi:MAG: pentapeptide repeat-containing protein [Pleurocapsa sp. MO_226.B13]|nr:pentapeptide repeat-containing protein [Pleurocapsa sp. MO_226.B13]
MMKSEEPDVFSLNSQWWLADVASQEESVGMFADIQLGYLLNNSQGDNKSRFLIISANKDRDKGEGFSNENIPKILEQLEPWLYYQPDISAIAQQLKLEPNNSDTQVASNIQRLLDTKECPRCNLTNADLEGANLKGANLEGANLEGANLEGAKLKRAYLLGANLNNANLYKANLENSIMLLASLENSDLGNANLQAANLKYANLNNADLTQAKLDGNGLNVTQLQNANLINANLT